MKISITARQGIVASPGYSIVGIDFCSQELLIAAMWSQDPKMLGVFKEPETKTLEDGTVYPNPWADLHTLTTVFCCYPELFKGKGEHEWVKIAKNASLNKGVEPRKDAKVVNFGILFMQTASSLAEQRCVPLEVAESWVSNHRKTYKTFHEWSERIATKGELCGWTSTPWGHRIRWVQESNAKKAGESPGRSGVNHVIQGTGADIGKLALVRVGKYCRQKGIRIVTMVHDEIVFEVPGVCRFNEEKSVAKDGVYTKVVWDAAEETLEHAYNLQKIMEDAESEIFNFEIPGRCSCSIAPYWSK